MGPTNVHFGKLLRIHGDFKDEFVGLKWVF